MRRENDKIDFNFYDAHDLFVAKDTSTRDTIKRRLRERLNVEQVVRGSADAKEKGGDNYSFLAHEIDVIQEFDLPIVIANSDGGRYVNNSFIPKPLLDADYDLFVSIVLAQNYKICSGQLFNLQWLI